jgi:hypothetical protein
MGPQARDTQKKAEDKEVDIRAQQWMKNVRPVEQRCTGKSILLQIEYKMSYEWN